MIEAQISVILGMISHFKVLTLLVYNITIAEVLERKDDIIIHLHLLNVILYS